MSVHICTGSFASNVLVTMGVVIIVIVILVSMVRILMR